MSFDLWARPAPRNRPEPVSLYPIKHVLARRLLGGDGSLRTDPIVVTKAMLGPWLEGVRDSRGDGMGESAGQLLALLEENPQGVELWIGDHDDGG